MQPMYNCPQCGKPVPYGAQYCENCGTQITWPAQPQQQQPPYQQPSYQQPPYQQPPQQSYGQPYMMGAQVQSGYVSPKSRLAVTLLAFFLGTLAFKTNQPGLGWFAVALGGACAGFLPYNFRMGKSAMLFLGDAGSTFLGFTLAGLAVLGKWSTSSNFVSLTAPILIFGVLIFDMIYVTLSRIKNRKTNDIISILINPNKDHLHHRLLFLGFASKETVFIISILSTCLGVSALIIMNQKLFEAFLGLLQAVMILGLIVSLMLKGREKDSDEGDVRI